MENRVNKSIVCAYLYIISKYGYPPPAEDTLKHLEEMHILGFQSIELEGIRERHLLSVYQIRHKIKYKLDELKLQVPYFCIVLPGLAAYNNVIREKNLQLFEKGCEIAQVIGAQAVLDNAPLPPYQFPHDIPVVRHYDEDVLLGALLPKRMSWKKYWSELITTYRQVCEIAASKGLTYHLHPCLGVLAASADAFLYFFNAVKRDNLRFAFDTANQYMMKENLSLALMRLNEHIDYIHISDNRGIKVEHLMPGEGAINWNIFFATLKSIAFKGYIGLDIGGEESSLANINQTYLGAAQWLQAHWDFSMF